MPSAPLGALFYCLRPPDGDSLSPVSDRLADLNRQRALAQEQLAWLDREIARETQASTPTGGIGADKPAAPPSVDRAADEILAQYRQNPENTEKSVKRGCYLYFAFALGAVVLFVVGAYLIYARRR